VKGKKKMSAVLTPAVLRAAAAYFGRMGGKSKSAAKVKAVRENGKLGGRPRKKVA